MKTGIRSIVAQLLHNEAAGGLLLLLVAAAALIWANSPLAAGYDQLWHASLASRSLHFWINDGLMTVFFLVVGMEIRREIHDGALSTLQLASLPLAAAAGGVALPALLYLAFNPAAPLNQGWAVPTATDIAFALGVLALLGRSIPANVRVLLLALAIIDDIAAVLIIALFYTGGFDFNGVLIGVAGVLMVLAMQGMRIGNAWAYVLPGAVLWYGFLQTGAHPALAGVALGMMTPVRAMRGQRADVAPPSLRVQMALHPWVTFGVMPLFALANAGVSLDGAPAGTGVNAVMLGTTVGLFLGKPLGIFFTSWLVVRLGWCRLPPGVSWTRVLLIGLLGGIGFTMSIFIATLAFADASLLAAAKLGVLVASAVAGIAGLLVGRHYTRQREAHGKLRTRQEEQARP